METQPGSPELPAEPVPIQTIGEAPAPPPADPHEAFALLEILLRDAFGREDA